MVRWCCTKSNRKRKPPKAPKAGGHSPAPAPVPIPPVPPPPPAPASPPPDPTPPPPPLGAWPPAVRAAGLGEVYDLRSSAGPTSPANKTPSNAPGLLPAGASLSSVLGFPVLVITQAASFERWDFSGWAVSIQAAVTVAFTDCRFQAPRDSGMQALYGGSLSGTSGVTINLVRCHVDGATNLPPTSPLASGAKPPQNLLSVNSTITASRSVFVSASKSTINCDGPGASSFSWCYFGCPAQKVYSSSNAELNTHAEVGNLAGGDVIIDHCLFDCADGAEQALSVHAETCVAGLFLFSPRVSHLDCAISNSLLLIRNLPSEYTMQGGDGDFGADLTFTNNVIQRPTRPSGGLGGHISFSGSNLSGAGNRDFDGGSLLSGAINIP